MKWNSLPTRFGQIRTLIAGSSSKKTVMLMPDPPNVIEHLFPLIENLSEDHQVIAFEGPGFGFSNPSKDFDFSVSQQSDLIIEILEKNQVQEAILAFTCVAALSAVRAAEKRPDLIKGLLVAQCSSVSEEKKWAEKVDFKGLLGTPGVGQLLVRVFPGFIAKKWYQAAFPKGADSGKTYQIAIDSLRKGARFSLASAFQNLQKESSQFLSGPLKTKTVVLWGMVDRTHRKTDKSDVLKYFENAKVVELPACGHFPDVEFPKEFAQAIREI